MRADTGVGPAMASGNQVCSGNCPDLEVTPPNRHSAPTSRSVVLAPPPRAYSLRWSTLKLDAPAAKKVMVTPTMRPMSPTRLVRKALSAASVFFFSSHQCPMSPKEHTPTSSQPISICRVLEPST